MRTQPSVLWSLLAWMACLPAAAAPPEFGCDEPLIDAARIAGTDIARRLVAAGFQEEPAGGGIYVRDSTSLAWLEKEFRLEDRQPVPSVDHWMEQATIEGNHTVLDQIGGDGGKPGDRLLRVSVNLGYARPRQICVGMPEHRVEAALRLIGAEELTDVGALQGARPGHALCAWLLPSRTALVVECERRKLGPGKKPTLPLVTGLVAGGEGRGVDNWKGQEKRRLEKLALEQPGEAEVRAALRPWDDFRESWFEGATVILTGRLGHGSYPCVERVPGELDMIQQDYFEVVDVLRGRVAVRYLDVDLFSPSVAALPPYFVEDRSYLLFLRPSAGSQKLLDDPKTIFGLGNRLPTGEVIAIVDLTQTEAEAAANRTRATRSGRLGDFEFSPQAWEALRAADRVDFARQDRFLFFLGQVVLVERATRVDVRSWLGPPDRQHHWKGGAHEDAWYLNLRAYRTPRDGDIYTQLEVTYAPDGRIARYTIEHLRWTLEPKRRTSSYMQESELSKAGLKRVEKEFAR